MSMFEANTPVFASRGAGASSAARLRAPLCCCPLAHQPGRSWRGARARSTRPSLRGRGEGPGLAGTHEGQPRQGASRRRMRGPLSGFAGRLGCLPCVNCCDSSTRLPFPFRPDRGSWQVLTAVDRKLKPVRSTATAAGAVFLRARPRLALPVRLSAAPLPPCLPGGLHSTISNSEMATDTTSTKCAASHDPRVDTTRTCLRENGRAQRLQANGPPAAPMGAQGADDCGCACGAGHGAPVRQQYARHNDVRARARAHRAAPA